MATNYYYKLNENEIIYSAKLGKRIAARLLDFIIAGLIGSLLATIYVWVAAPGIPSEPTNALDYYLLDYYDPVLMSGWAVALSGTFFYLWLVPLLNFRHPGQTIGKRVLNITPMFLSDRNVYWSIAFREFFVSGFQLIWYVCILIVGMDVSYLFASYREFYNAFEDPTTQGLVYIGTQWQFIFTIWPDSTVMGSMVSNPTKMTFGFLSEFFKILWFAFLVIITFTVAFMKNKRGLHDIAAKTVIVDLKSKTEFVVEEKTVLASTQVQNLPPAILKK